MLRCWGLSGCFAVGLILVNAVASAGTPRAAQVVATQPVVVTPRPFAPDDPAMKDPQAAKALSATMVSATFANTPALQAFAELAKQSGYTIEPYNAGGGGQARYGSVTATLNNVPFWAAMREICTRGNVGLYYYGDNEGGAIQLMPTNYGQQHMMKASTSVQGPYLTVVTNLERINTVQMSAPDQTDRKISMQIHTFAEPKARPTQYAYQPVIDEAVDDNGNSMVPTAPQGQHQHMQSTRGISWYGHVQLPYPTSNPGKRIAKLRGHMPAKVQLQSEPWEIDNPLQAAEATRTFGSKKVTFKSFKKSSGGQYTIEMVYHRDPTQDQQSFNDSWNNEPDMKLIDAKDSRYRLYSSGGRGDDKQITRTFTFARRTAGGDDAPDPTKLVIEVPTAVQEIDIPFELVDLPMP